MHRDTKLGLALGILLVGIVGAFFFRNERAPHDDAPALQDPQALDEQIAELPVAPYLLPETSDPPPPVMSPAAGPAALLVSDSAWTGPAAGPPPPISTDRRLSDPLVVQRNVMGDPTGVPVPDHNTAWETVDPQAPTAAASPAAPRPTAAATPTGAVAPAPSAGVTAHRVRTGDTLSGLAARYLGSSARFLEIYEANRDVLRSPDDLRVGLTLRIPAAAPSPVPPVQTLSTPPPAAAEAPEPAGDKPRLFTPVSRPPLFPGIGAAPAALPGNLADLPAEVRPNAAVRR